MNQDEMIRNNLKSCAEIMLDYQDRMLRIEICLEIWKNGSKAAETTLAAIQNIIKGWDD